MVIELMQTTTFACSFGRQLIVNAMQLARLWCLQAFRDCHDNDMHVKLNLSTTRSECSLHKKSPLLEGIWREVPEKGCDRELIDAIILLIFHILG
jgi:hypothetical protein